MSPVSHTLPLFLSLGCLLAPSVCRAQVPTASGRQIAMSNAAWKLFIPSTYEPRAGGVADLLIHFHGDPQTYWNNARYAHLNALIVTVNYSGLSSAYSTPFANSALFQSIVDEALTKVRAQSDFADNLAWDKLGVSSFSAGYGAVREILKSSTYRGEIDALLAADSLYATTAGDGTPLDSQMADYKTFAGLAKNGQKTFLYSHSQVPTYTYENTAECGDELMQSLGIQAHSVASNGLGTLQFYREASVGNFKLWGATGSDGDSHLEHLRYIGDFLEDLPLAKLTPPAADFDKNYAVAAGDLAVWKSSFGGSAAADANHDGAVDGRDFLAWQRSLGATVGTATVATAVPEPATLLLAAVTLAAAGRRRHNRV